MTKRNLSMLVPKATLEPDVARWATVTQTSPLRIKLDGETTALPFTPDSLVSGLMANDRVWVALATNGDPSVKSRRVVVLGRNGGANPAGIIQQFAGDVLPTGWLWCDGAAISRTTYAQLFVVIASKYGAGNGTTTFNVPNIQGRVPVGRDAGQTEFDVLGETGGEKTHLLTTAEMPNHVHAQFVTASVTPGAGVRTDYTADAASSSFPQGVNTGGAGGDQAHNNLQPYIVLNYIIKI